MSRTSVGYLAAICAAVPAATLAILLACNFALTFVDPGFYRARAARAVDSNLLISRSGFPFFAADRPYRYGVNDCLILTMLADPRPSSRLAAALSPSIPDFGAVRVAPEFVPNGFDQARNEPASLTMRRKTPRANECFWLKKSLAERPPSVFPYSQYIHGYVTLTGTLLLPFSYAAATGLLYAIAIAMPFLLLACVFNSRDAHHGMERKAAFGAMGIAYLLFSGVTYFAWQVDLAPAEIILGLALLFAFFHPLIELRPRKLCAAAALFGSLCVSFDFLRGLIPSALTLLIGLFAIEPSADEGSRIRKACLAAASFVFAIIFAFVLKQAAVAVFAPSNGVSVATGQLAVHISQSTWDVNPSAIEALARHGVSVEAIKSNRLFAFIYALAKLAYFSDLLAFGIRPLGVLIVVVGPAALVALGCIRLWRPSPALPRVAAALLVLSVFVPLAWVFIFIEHTIDTAVIMQRMLAWPAILLAGVAAKLISLRREQHVAVRNPAAGKVAVVEPDI